MLISAGLFAQKGLFNIRYGMSVDEVDEVLAKASFFAEESEGNAIKYFSDISPTVAAILVFIEPKSQKVAGWFVKYQNDIGLYNNHLIIERIRQMHGTKNVREEETGQLIWFLTDTRTLHLIMTPDESLTALYYDSLYPELFSFEHKE